MATLRDELGNYLAGCEYVETPAYKLLDVEVVASHGLNTKSWPGRHRYVYNWVELANGKAVGFNENPSRGWSFPVIPYRSTPV